MWFQKKLLQGFQPKLLSLPPDEDKIPHTLEPMIRGNLQTVKDVR